MRYYAQGNRYVFYATRDEVMLSLGKQKGASQLALALRFVGRNPRSAPEGAVRAPGRVNYLRGADPTKWRTQLARYRDVVYRELWPRIDLRLHEQGGLEVRVPCPSRWPGLGHPPRICGSKVPDG